MRRMAARARRSKVGSGSSSNSKSLRSTDVSDPSLGASKLLPVIEPLWMKYEPSEEFQERVCTDEEFQDYTRPYAMAAMNFYNETEGTKYELVEPGFVSHALISRCFLTHIDFTAKKTDVADAPEEMFFAELTGINEEALSVKVCKCMGLKESISGDKNNGCCYCMDYLVQHPRDGGFLAGGVGLFSDEKRNF